MHKYEIHFKIYLQAHNFTLFSNTWNKKQRFQNASKIKIKSFFLKSKFHSIPDGDLRTFLMSERKESVTAQISDSVLFSPYHQGRDFRLLHARQKCHSCLWARGSAPPLMVKKKRALQSLSPSIPLAFRVKNLKLRGLVWSVPMGYFWFIFSIILLEKGHNSLESIFIFLTSQVCSSEDSTKWE